MDGDDTADAGGGADSAGAAEPAGASGDAVDAATDDADGSTYRGLLGAYPYALRASDSWLFRAFALAGGLFAVGVVVLFALGLVVLVAATASVRGGSLTLSRAFYLVVMVLILIPLTAPVLFVARRHRRTGSTRGYDAAMGLVGFAFVFALYLGLLISAPPDQREAPPAAVAPAVEFLYDLPAVAAVVPPVAAAAAVLAVHRLLR